jgi:ribonuclease Z
MVSTVFRGVIGMAFFVLVLFPVAAQGQAMTVTLLGTGAPPPVMNRFGPSTLVEAGGERLLFDVGRGALQRLFQLKVPLKDVYTLFLTHLHSDHIVGIPDLYLTGWVNGWREVPLRLWGPLGAQAMMAHLERAFESDIRIRLYDDRPPPQGIVVQVQEIREGVVYERNGVKVTAFEVDYYPLKPAFGYRIDYAGRSVVLSGDTRFSENLIRHAQGADVLIHEVVAPESLSRAGYAPERVKAIIDHHVTPEQAGEVFARVKPRLAVYSHIVLPIATEEE